jgi:hypothetical protein
VQKHHFHHRPHTQSGRTAYFWAIMDLLVYTYCGLDLNRQICGVDGVLGGAWASFFLVVVLVYSKSSIRDKLKLTQLRHRTRTLRQTDGMACPNPTTSKNFSRTISKFSRTSLKTPKSRSTFDFVIDLHANSPTTSGL